MTFWEMHLFTFLQRELTCLHVNLEVSGRFAWLRIKIGNGETASLTLSKGEPEAVASCSKLCSLVSGKLRFQTLINRHLSPNYNIFKLRRSALDTVGIIL